MIPVLSFVLLSLIVSINAQWQQTCGGAGYDLASLIGTTVRGSFIGWEWVIAPCGSITNATDSACFMDQEAQFGSMMCQRTLTNSSVYTVANWNETVARTGSQWAAITNGVSLRVVDGERCAAINHWREATFEFMCDPSATRPVLVSVSEPETCWYVARINTAAACQAVSPTMVNQVGNSFYSHQCGAGFYDLTSLSTADMTWDDVDYEYKVRVCALVSNATCASAGPTSFCQRRKDVTSAVDVSDFNSSIANLYSVTPIGLDIDLKSGASCAGNGLRQATYHLVCNPRAVRPILSNVYESPICWYHAIIQTNTVCTGTNQPGQGYCGGAGYDLTPLQNLDLSLTAPTREGGTVYNWLLHPCGVLSPWFTNACANQNSMFCQRNNATGGAQSVAMWNRTIAETATWMAITNGVQLYVQTGALCPAASNLPRDTAIQFICDRSARLPRFTNISEPETCYYVAVIYTEAACDLVGATAPHTPGSTYQDQTCGGGYYDLSDIRDEIGDLVLDSNPGQPSGYMYYLELCGQVSHPDCSSVQPSMFCQVSKSDKNNNYSLAAYQENQMQVFTINNNGMTIQVQTGTPCGAILNRKVTINIVCDGSVPAVMTSVREVETCHYTAIVRGRCDYGNTEPFSTRAPLPRSSSSSIGTSPAAPGSSTAARSSTAAQGEGSSTAVQGGSSTAPVGGDDSSKSSGLGSGAIAGIVIGSVVGALVLLACLFFLCCSGLGRSGKNTKFNEMSAHHEEESRTGEVEMESA